MRIGIEINGVLRNTIGKIEQTYEKFYIDKMEGVDDEDTFEYKMNLPVTSLDLRKHFEFQTDEELYSFLYEEFSMEIFGHAQSTDYNTFKDLQEIYVKYRDDNELVIVSDEIGKSKPSTLFFLSKFICQVEKIKFYSNFTINSMWNEIDILLTSNPMLLLEYPTDKIVVKYETEYNKDIQMEHTITTLNEFDDKLKELLEC
jgi:hypothetical protein